MTRLLLLLPLVLVALLAGCRRTTVVAPPPEPLFEGRPALTVLSPADFVRVTPTSIEIRKALDPRHREKETFVFPAPPGELDFEVRELVLRHRLTGEERPAIEDGEALIPSVLVPFRRAVTLEPMGWLRSLPLAKLSVDSRRSITVGNESFEYASYTIHVRHDPVPSNETILTPPVLGDRLFPRIASRLVAAPSPEAWRPHLRPPPPNPFPGPTQWQPRPEDSPLIPWQRLGIEQDGLVAIDAAWLTEAGLDPDAIDPANLVLYSRGTRVPLFRVGEMEGGFGDGARLVFHAQANDSPETRVRVYYLGGRAGGGGPEPWVAPPVNEAPAPTAFARRAVLLEEDNEFLKELGAFLSIRNMRWLWKALAPLEPVNVEFDLPGFVPRDGDATTTATITLHYEQPPPGGATLAPTLNGQTLEELQLLPRETVYTVDLPTAILRAARNSLQLRIGGTAAESSDGARGRVYLDHAEIEYAGILQAKDGVVRLEGRRNPEYRGAQALALTGLRGEVLALDLTNPDLPARFPAEVERGRLVLAGTLDPAGVWLAAETRRIDRAPSPIPAAYLSLDDPNRGADAIVLYHPRFEEVARELAASMETDGYVVASTPVDSVYASFSHGETSWEGIRNYLAFAVNDWTGRRPEAVLLLGDATSDGRDVARLGLPNDIPIPLVESTLSASGDQFSTDSVYSWLVGEDEVADLVVGRISAHSVEDARAAAANVLMYRQGQDVPASWPQRILTIFDTREFAPALEPGIIENLQPGAPHEVLLADSFPWEDNYYLPPDRIRRVEDSKVSPLMTAAIESAFNEGTGTVAFFGHGAPNLWSNHRFWFGGGTPNSDLIRLEPNGRLSFVASFTCNNAVIDYPLEPWNISLAEDFLRHEGSGAVACFMPSGPGYVTRHSVLADAFYRARSLLGVRHHGVLAELVRLAYQAEIGPDDHSRMFLLLGDPTLRFPPAPVGDGAEALPDPDAGAVPLLIREVNVIGGTIQLAGQPVEVSVLLQNDDGRPAADRLVTTVRDGNGNTVYTDERPVRVGPRTALLERFAWSPTSAGLFTITHELPSDSGVFLGAQLPSRRATTHAVVTDDGGGLVVDKSRPSLVLPAVEGRRARGEIHVANISPETLDTTGTLRLIVDGEMKGTQTFGPVQLMSGVSRSISVAGEVDRETLRTAVVEFEGGWSSDRQSALVSESIPVFERSRLPDVALTGEITTRPQPHSDGVTVFVDAVVENRGETISEPVDATLFRDDGGGRRTLRDLTARQATTIAPLLPGESRLVTLRWDPVDNAGEYEIALEIDPKLQRPDRDRSNQRAFIPMKVRTKSRLALGGLVAEPGRDPGTVVLRGTVRNLGQTPARRVAVYFYSAPEQNDETFIGEVLVDEIPGEGSETAVIEWKAPKETREAETFAPSFAVALKGSLMRVSSATDDDGTP